MPRGSLSMSDRVRVRRYTQRRKTIPLRRRPAAVPRWRKTTYGFGGRYKDKRLAITLNPDGGWYWETTDRRAGVLGHGVASNPGTASREAELAAGYKYAGEILEQAHLT